jgi:hypothetical protein
VASSLFYLVTRFMLVNAASTSAAASVVGLVAMAREKHKGQPLPERPEPYPMSGIGAAPPLDDIPQPYRTLQRPSDDRARRSQRRTRTHLPNRGSLSPISEGSRF